MLKDIMVSPADTVNVDLDEYRDLVKRSAYLDVVMSFAGDPHSFILADVACVVRNLLEEPVITDEDETENEGNDGGA